MHRRPGIKMGVNDIGYTEGLLYNERLTSKTFLCITSKAESPPQIMKTARVFLWFRVGNILFNFDKELIVEIFRSRSE